jgi:hypothetical protein
LKNSILEDLEASDVISIFTYIYHKNMHPYANAASLEAIDIGRCQNIKEQRKKGARANLSFISSSDFWSASRFFVMD